MFKCISNKVHFRQSSVAPVAMVEYQTFSISFFSIRFLLPGSHLLKGFLSVESSLFNLVSIQCRCIYVNTTEQKAWLNRGNALSLLGFNQSKMSMQIGKSVQTLDYVICCLFVKGLEDRCFEFKIVSELKRYVTILHVVNHAQLDGVKHAYCRYAKYICFLRRSRCLF